MKTKILQPLFFIAFLLLLVACSTKKDTFLARNSHALSTKDNILYNGQMGLDKGMAAINANSKDNFWKRLPIEKMQILDDDALDKKPKNPDFELAETKATKAIQKHSMNIGGQEKNYQIDEAYLMLGKARYYDQRFFPALDAFNYILYKYPASNKIYQAKIWREKTNMRLGNDAQVIKNISKLLDENEHGDDKQYSKNFSKQIVADANALLAASFLNMEEKDSAIVKLKIAENYTKIKKEKSRYLFILAQLYQEMGKKDSAIFYYQSVIDRKRKADRDLVIHAYAQKAQLFDYQNGDKEAFVKKYNQLADDRENRPFLDVIFYQMGVFYEKQNDPGLAEEFYNASLRRNSTDSYLVGSDYRNLGNMYFKDTQYSKAAKYYDSTLVKLNPKTREHIHIKKLRKDLDEVIEYETIAKNSDSVLNLMSLTETNRILYFEKHIEQLKKDDEAKKIAAEKQELSQSKPKPNDNDTEVDTEAQPPATATAAVVGNTPNTFYFYNPTTVAYGKLEFKKKYGNRLLVGNWRSTTTKTAGTSNEITENTSTTQKEESALAEQYTTNFYLKQLPKSPTEVDEIVKKRNLAYYQLGVIYKEKFKEYDLASNKLEQLLTKNPEEKLVLPTLYNLYKIYQITNVAKAEEMKTRILSQYPDSRYAQIITNKTPDVASIKGTPEEMYGNLYKLYEDEQFSEALQQIDPLITQYSGDEIVPKLELLKANILGKTNGLTAYKNAMQSVADNYPTSEEGKQAFAIFTTQIPTLEAMNFQFQTAKSWKIIYKLPQTDSKTAKEIEEKYKKFFATENIEKVTYSKDNYTDKEVFVVVHGFQSENYAKSVALMLQEDKKYKIAEPAIVISTENYKVVQIKKNLEEYLVAPRTVSVVVPPTTTTIADPAKPEKVKPNVPTTAPTGMLPPVRSSKPVTKP